jgi:hypothetical protein
MDSSTKLITKQPSVLMIEYTNNRINKRINGITVYSTDIITDQSIKFYWKGKSA